MTVETQTLPQSETSSKSGLLDRLKKCRAFTEELTRPLKTEDFIIQAATHASPAKWHLAHTSWFFEVFLLEKTLPDYKTLHPQYGYLFNSYYLQTGDPHCRDKRGSLSRPTVEEVFEYRRYIDEKLDEFFHTSDEVAFQEWADVIEIGINHEQQHQELLITDLKLMFSQNPLYPKYQDLSEVHNPNQPAELTWTSFDEGVYETGHAGGGFGYDNEFPRHKTYIHDFELANRPVTSAEFLEFMESGAYENPKFWLDEGFSMITEKQIRAPKYWIKENGEWRTFTLGGLKKIEPHEPVTHVSYYEADAYARWKGCRLPTEQEWELAASLHPDTRHGHFAETGHFHPVPAEPSVNGIQQIMGNVWEWTSSAYSPYPGYRPFEGKLGEYNGKFMCSQYVLRGGSCATSRTHIRPTYRNFFHPQYRWQFSGIRLAR